MTPRQQLIAGLALLFGIAICFILYLAWPLMSGTDTILATRPVDPFDPFRGQYMQINYEVANVPALPNVVQGDTVYVSLTPDEKGIARYAGASTLEPTDGLFLRGSVENNNGETMRVHFGIEQFFFEQNANVPTQNVTVHVRIANSGVARIVELLQNDKPIVIQYKPVR